MKPLKIGLCGLGTVAQGVLGVLSRNQVLICGRAGREIEIVRVASRTPKPEVDLLGASFSTDLDSILNDPDIDLVLELIGGERAALDVIRRSLSAGKNVVTANKAVLAAHGDELFALAAQADRALSYEAAVAGSIPIISVLNHALAGNRVQWLAGIINGTSNYILTAMSDTGQSFEEALSDAQALGYAEADPTFDVEGIDAAHKLTILAALAFGIGFRFDEVYTEGIAGVSVEDIEYAREMGYQIKHLGIARNTPDGVQLRVHPTLISNQQLLASVHGVMNAVLVNGDAAGDTLHFGAGAGALPTASAVLADVIDIARQSPVSVPLQAQGSLTRVLAIDDVVCAHYLKIPVLDKSGVFARLATILSDHDISIEAAIQKEQAIHTETQETWVPIIILTQAVRESVIRDALLAVAQMPEVIEEIGRIRVEDFAGG